MSKPNDLLQRAISFAAREHHGQFRKDDKTPYVAHVFRVAFTVRHVFGVDDETTLAAAFLHDTLEDTTVDYDDLEKEFGREIADIVVPLTKDCRMQEGAREEFIFENLARAPWPARLIKFADTYDNVLDSATSKVATKSHQKAADVLALPLEGHPSLARAHQLLTDLVSAA